MASPRRGGARCIVSFSSLLAIALVLLALAWAPTTHAMQGDLAMTAAADGGSSSQRNLLSSSRANNKARGGKPTQYVIFTDSDEDDTMAITIMAIQQALYGDVEIAGIVVEDGFLGIDQGLQWLSYWTQTLFPQLRIPLVRGYPREPYLRQTRYFPLPWVTEYTGLLDTYYPAWTTWSPTPAPETPEAFMDRLLSSSTIAKGTRYQILNIGPTTTLPKLLELYPAFAKRVVYAASDLGSIGPKLIYPNVPTPQTTVDSTWNAFMNPDGLAKALQELGRPKAGAFALTTSECTGASVVNTTTVAYMQAVGNSFLSGSPSPSPGAVSYYNSTMNFLVNIVLGLGVREGSSVSLWDAVTALVLLGVPIDQHLIPNLPLTISWTGKTNFVVLPSMERKKGRKPRVGKCDRVAQTYDRMEPLLFFRQFIALVFQPLGALAVVRTTKGSKGA